MANVSGLALYAALSEQVNDLIAERRLTRNARTYFAK